MAGYTRQDTTGQIANGEAIDADDINAEFTALQTAFSVYGSSRQSGLARGAEHAGRSGGCTASGGA